MASLVYDNKKIIPAPLVNINKIYRTSNDGLKHGVMYEISLVGTILPFRGSPSGNYNLGDPSDAFWTLTGQPPDEVFAPVNDAFSNIERKQEAIRWLFREDGKVLEWFGEPNPPVKCRPKIKSITFPEGQWVDRSQYNITLEAESLTGIIEEDVFDASGLQSVSEEWQFNEIPGHEARVYEISHTVSAQGILTFDEITGTAIQALSNAKVWADARIDGNPDNTFVNFATGFTDWVNGKYVKNTTISEKDGSYAISEIWIIREAGPGENAAIYQEDSFTVTHNTANESIDVTYNGTIFGLHDQERTGGLSAINNAKNAIPTNAEAKVAAEISLSNLLNGFVIPISPTQKNIAINEKDAVITFNFTWSASEDADFTSDSNATLSFNSSDGVYSLNFEISIEGKGSTKEERLDNARSNIPTDIAAKALAINLIGSQIPTGITFAGLHISKSSALSNTQGTSKTSWTWTDKDINNVNIGVSINFPQIISAKLVIPGRIAGPVIQRINTATAKQITVNYNSEGHGSTKPDSDIVSDTMDNAGGVPFGILISPWFPGSYILESDSESWNPTNGTYSRTRTHTVTESGA